MVAALPKEPLRGGPTGGVFPKATLGLGGWVKRCVKFCKKTFDVDIVEDVEPLLVRPPAGQRTPPLTELSHAFFE